MCLAGHNLAALDLTAFFPFTLQISVQVIDVHSNSKDIQVGLDVLYSDQLNS